MKSSRRWKEIWEGGSAEAEHAILLRRAEELLRVLAARSVASGADRVVRTMYAKTAVGVTNALLVVDRVIPRDLAVAHFCRGARLPAAVRLSNASAVAQSDRVPDMRGFSLRLLLAGGGIHDLILASFPTAIARNARQSFELTLASLGERETLLARLAARIGIAETRRIAANLRSALKLCTSFERQRYWSGCAFLWGNYPAQLELRPTAKGTAAAAATRDGDALRMELAANLATRDVTFRLAVHRYVDERRTPIEDCAVRWRDAVSPPVEIATLVIPRQDLSGSEAQSALLQVDRTVFDPWNAPAEFRPLGSLNRLRRFLYRSRAIGDYVAQHRAITPVPRE